MHPEWLAAQRFDNPALTTTFDHYRLRRVGAH